EVEKGQKDQKDPENAGRLVTPAKKLEETIRLAELVIEVLQQNQEHHAEAQIPPPRHVKISERPTTSTTTATTT
ncbi:hypothetical protein CRUP_022987, partial [Coryphaenoides rupestris]